MFLDDNSVKAIDVCGNYEKYKDVDTLFYPTFGNNEGYVVKLLSKERFFIVVILVKHQIK